VLGDGRLHGAALIAVELADARHVGLEVVVGQELVHDHLVERARVQVRRLLGD